MFNWFETWIAKSDMTFPYDFNNQVTRNGIPYFMPHLELDDQYWFLLFSVAILRNLNWQKFYICNFYFNWTFYFKTTLFKPFNTYLLDTEWQRRKNPTSMSTSLTIRTPILNSAILRRRAAKQTLHSTIRQRLAMLKDLSYQWSFQVSGYFPNFCQFISHDIYCL